MGYHLFFLEIKTADLFMYSYVQHMYSNVQQISGMTLWIWCGVFVDENKLDGDINLIEEINRQNNQSGKNAKENADSEIDQSVHEWVIGDIGSISADGYIIGVVSFLTSYGYHIEQEPQEWKQDRNQTKR